jgi:hypothetical protein
VTKALVRRVARITPRIRRRIRSSFDRRDIGEGRLDLALGRLDRSSVRPALLRIEHRVRTNPISPRVTSGRMAQRIAHGESANKDKAWSGADSEPGAQQGDLARIEAAAGTISWLNGSFSALPLEGTSAIARSTSSARFRHGGRVAAARHLQVEIVDDAGRIRRGRPGSAPRRAREKPKFSNTGTCPRTGGMISARR